MGLQVSLDDLTKEVQQQSREIRKLEAKMGRFFQALMSTKALPVVTITVLKNLIKLEQQDKVTHPGLFNEMEKPELRRLIFISPNDTDCGGFALNGRERLQR